MMRFSMRYSGFSSGSRSFRCSAMARCGYSQSTWKMLGKRSHRYCILEQTGPNTFECGGPRVYSYEELLRAVANVAGIKSVLFPVPFAAWGALALISEMLPNPPITRNQVELMQIDSTPTPGIPGLEELGISPHSVEEILRDILRS